MRFNTKLIIRSIHILITILLIQISFQNNYKIVAINFIKSAFIDQMADDNQSDENQYRQDLGLKKILYKYQNENQQLRSQIKALSERLNSIMTKPKSPVKKQVVDPIQEFQGKLLKEEMEKLFKEINKQTELMKIHKQGIDQRHQEKCKQVQNRIVKQTKQINEYKAKLAKYEKLDDGIKLSNVLMRDSKVHKDGVLNIEPTLLSNKTLKSSTVRIQTYSQKLHHILDETDLARRNIKQMERQRDSNERNLKKKHTHQEDVKGKNKVIQFGKLPQQPHQEAIKRKGIVGMENTKENYQFLSQQMQRIRKDQNEGLETIRNENIVIENKIIDLENQLEALNKSVEIPPLPYQKRPTKQSADFSISMSRKLQSPLMKKSQRYELDNHVQYQPNNDKNFAPKKMRKVEWESTKNKSGIQWFDGNIKSPIIGINLWFDGVLLGAEFIHELGNSSQHLHLMGKKKIMPIQYRLSAKDYVQNVILYISEGLIHGIQLISKTGRVDMFGNKNKARKFDFGIKSPEKPVITFGQFRVNNNNFSEITKLGFQVI